MCSARGFKLPNQTIENFFSFFISVFVCLANCSQMVSLSITSGLSFNWCLLACFIWLRHRRVGRRGKSEIPPVSRHPQDTAHILRIDYPFAFFSLLLFSRIALSRAYVLGCNASRNSMPFLIMAFRVELGCRRCVSRWFSSSTVFVSFSSSLTSPEGLQNREILQNQKTDTPTTLLDAFVPSLPINYVFFASPHSLSAEIISIANNFYLLVVQERLWIASENALCKGLIRNN